MSRASLEKTHADLEVVDNEKIAQAQLKLEHLYTKWEAAKLYPRACIYIAIMVWAMITVGYENQAGGIVISIPTFRKDFGHAYKEEYVLDGNWQSAISGGPYAAFVFGSFISSALIDRVGRKYLVWVAVALTFAFIGIEYAATSIKVFFIGKFLNAICLGVIQTLGASYIAELTPLALRGIATTCANLAMCVGPFVCTIITNETAGRLDRSAYRAIFCSQWAFAGSTIVFFWFLPESPYHFALKNNDEKALRCLRKIYTQPGMPEAQLQIIKANIEEARTLAAAGSYKELVDKKNRKRTMVAISAFVFQPMVGLAYVSSYQTYYYQLAGFNVHRSFQISVGAQALSVSGTIVSFFIVDRFGRRFVAISGMITLGILNVFTAALSIPKGHSYVTGAAAFLTMYNFFYNSGIGSISYVINTEVPTSSLRAKAVSVGVCINYSLMCMWSFVLPYMVNPDQLNMGGTINFIFAGCCVAALVFFYLYLPETAGRSYDEIDEIYKAGIPPRKWKEYKTMATGGSDTNGDSNSTAESNEIESTGKVEVTYVERIWNSDT